MIGKIATSVRTDGRFTVVRYHQTDVVKFSANLIALNTGGWFTATTKKRMNQTSETFGLGYRVYQYRRAWFCSYHGRTLALDAKGVLILNRTIGR